jgi:hypothetical protein
VLTTCGNVPDIGCVMRKPKPGSQKLAEAARKRQPKRPHFIQEWAERAGFDDQAALVEALDADKSVVSRWYGGASPGEEWQLKLCALFGHPNQPEIIFQHPDSVWFTRFFRNREEDEIERMKKMLEAAFPPS